MSASNIQCIPFPPRAAQFFVASAKIWQEQFNPYHSDTEALAEIAGDGMFVGLQAAGSDGAAVLKFANDFKSSRVTKPTVISGVPVDPVGNLGATPTHRRYSGLPKDIQKTGFITEFALLALNRLLDLKPTKTPEIQQSMPFHHLCPLPDARDHASGVGAADFPWHTERTYDPLCWTYVLILAALRNQATPTSLAGINDVLNWLEAELLASDFEKLKEPRFNFHSGIAFGPGQPEAVYTGAMLEQVNNQTILRLNANPEKLSCAPGFNADETQQLINHMADILEAKKSACGVVLHHGDVAVIGNDKVIHARDEIVGVDLLFGQERWLVRTQSIRNLHF